MVFMATPDTLPRSPRLPRRRPRPPRYGDTEAPSDVSAYSIFHLVGDLVALIDSLGQEQASDSLISLSLSVILCYSSSRFNFVLGLKLRKLASLKVFVVGHDWGAIVAWNLSAFRPDKVNALVNLSVAFLPRKQALWRVDSLRAIYGDDFYVSRFQEPGEVEAQFAQVDTAILLKSFLTSRSTGPLIIPKGKGFVQRLNKDIALPSWLSKDDINYYASKFVKTGFAGGLNYYRNMDKNWELTAPWSDVQIKVPTKFIVGDLDLAYHFAGMKDYIHKGGFKGDVPFLDDVIVMEGVAHFINQEKPEEISNYIYEFIQNF